MDTIQRFRNDVAANGRGRVREIADATGLSPKTLYNLAGDALRRPAYNAAVGLAAYYARVDAVKAGIVAAAETSTQQQSAGDGRKRQMMG